MKLYLASLGAGLLVGIIYALLQVRSPAPPVVALIGLFGILIGEQIPPLAKRIWSQDQQAFGWMTHFRPHVLGTLPAAIPLTDARRAGEPGDEGPPRQSA